MFKVLIVYEPEGADIKTLSTMATISGELAELQAKLARSLTGSGEALPPETIIQA